MKVLSVFHFPVIGHSLLLFFELSASCEIFCICFGKHVRRLLLLQLTAKDESDDQQAAAFHLTLGLAAISLHFYQVSEVAHNMAVFFF